MRRIIKNKVPAFYDGKLNLKPNLRKLILKILHCVFLQKHFYRDIEYKNYKNIILTLSPPRMRANFARKIFLSSV